MVNETLCGVLARQHNDYTGLTDSLETKGIMWNDFVSSVDTTSLSVSIVIPARNVAYCLKRVLDALAAQTCRPHFEVVVVDDASTDATADIIARHPVVTTGRRLKRPQGAATARNLGTLLAQGDTVIYLDADMLLPANTVAHLAQRARHDLVLTGFRHNVEYETALPPQPKIESDHRVRWSPPVNTPLLYSGITLREPVDVRPLEATREFRDLGYGRRYYDWDLPRMVVTALLSVPRAAVLDIGGFDGEFGRIGWGMEDTFLGACLIAAGLKVVPVRHAVGFHLDPPDAAQQWKSKLDRWPATLARYRRQLFQPPPSGRRHSFIAAMSTALDPCEVLR